MLFYCLKSRKNKESKNPRIVKTNNKKLILLSKGALPDSKKLRFIKKKASVSLCNSGLSR